MYVLYYKAQNNKLALQECYETLYNGQLLQDTILQKIRSESIKTRLKIQKLEAEQSKLITLSTQDQLTTTLNRHGLNRLIDNTFEQAKNSQSFIGFIMIDIDYFKQYNDKYGHIAGDKYLQSVANDLKNILHGQGHVIRYGGDEFCILLINFTDLQIKEICEQISSVISASIGAVNAIPNLDSQFFDYLYTADTLLYETKKRCRNDYTFSNTLLTRKNAANI